MNSLRRQAFWQVLGTIINLGFPLVTFPYISRLLGPANLGTVNYVDSLVQFVAFIAAMGIPYYGIKETAQSKNDPLEQARVLYQLVAIHLLLVAVSSILFLVYTSQLSGVAVPTELMVYALIVLFTQPIMADWYFAGNQDFVFLVKRNVVARILTLAAIFMFIKDRDDFIHYYGLLVGVQVLQALWNASTYIKVHPFHLRYLQQFKRHYRPILIFFATNALISLYVYLDAVILGNVAGTKAVGLYSTGIKLMRLCLYVITAALSVLFPVIAVLSKKKELEAMQQLVSKAVQVIILIGLPVGLLMSVFAYPLIKFFAGSEFLSSSTVVMILSPLPMIIGLSNLFGLQILIPLGKEVALLKAVALASVIGLLLQVLMASYFSFTGTAVATLITETVVLMLTFIQVKRQIPIQVPSLFWKSCLLYLAGCAPVFAAIHYFMKDVVLQLASGVAWMALWIAFTLYIFQGPIWKDLLGGGEWIPFIGKRLKRVQV